MPKQSNIVSFEDARRSARKRSGAKTTAIQDNFVSAPSNKTRTLDETETEIQAKQKLASRLESRHAQAKRKRNKTRAARKFNAAYGGSSADIPAEGSPRAAVYKGKMGSKHRKAATALTHEGSKMQSAVSGFIGSIHLPSFQHAPRKTLRVLFSIVCVAFVCFMLYTPAQQCYQQIRERDRLQAEYDAVIERNAALENSVQNLQSASGIEDKAHSEYGMVKEGESAGSVSGIDVSQSSDFTANITPGSVPAPDTWYSDVLDTIFFYSK
ncbi:septum formation initiator family protein [Adlercreutzia sp. ZJ154]|uniref:FtsB family cell division protein n=1 Tax=Adlercreutzia sp. ZJ154 TaxID=2709790 RepID=UPI0013EB010C|nr:septum formation initiator family protein [Adlercreutzia sp. ZJ154]